MAIIITCMSPSPPPLLSISKPKLPHSCIKPHNLALSFNSPCSLSTPLLPKRTVHFQKIHRRKTQIWRIYATPEEALPSHTTPLESSQQIVSTSDDGTGTIVSVLLFIAFITLSVLTIGVIYIGVTDFLQKREREKFEKEEGTKKKKVKVKARAGPRGFGQKINEADDVDD